jgi:hypothetical protein
MATKKRKRARTRKTATTPKKKRKTHRRKKAHNPKRTHARRPRRAHRANPKRSHRRRRAHRANPSHFRRKSHRRRSSRRNPSGPLKDIGLAVLAGVAGFAATQAIGYYVTADQVKDGQRNRGIVGGLLAAGGAYAATKGKVGLGTGLALGSLLGAFGGFLTVKLFELMPMKKAPAAGAVYSDNLAAVFQDNLSAVFSDNMSGYEPQMGAMGMGAYAQDLGDLTPAAPWKNPTPFG